MISKEVIDRIIEYTSPESVKLSEPLSRYTTFKIGGPAKCLVDIGSERELTEVSGFLKKEKIPYFILGNGSNTLFSDEGFNGVVLHIGKNFSDVVVEGNIIRAKAGAILVSVAGAAYKNSLTGLEFASGIPGTVGGGIVMNAGAYDGEMKFVTKAVKALSPSGETVVLEGDELKLGYRSSVFRHSDYVVLEVIFELKPGKQEEIKAKMDDFNKRRREKQPLDMPSAGSTFKRPEGNFAGKLIMEAGLSGFTVGGAGVSEKHCGFVVNAGGATSKDVVTLIEEVQKRVFEVSGIRLEPEIEIVR
ncbi:MAG: UDP-N-acetylmuramate dehydrogenase [Lachnospiraceae bacterium]|nr:UDP-N-acetylmuramate dehydrogenase [Lachnospiraceae bacterium]